MISYICALRNNDIGGGMLAELYYTDPAQAARFAERHNGVGVGVYDCIGRLREDATQRKKEAVAALDRIIVDLDLKDIVETHEEILNALRGMVLRPDTIVDSGNGIHAVWHLKETVTDDIGLDQAEAIMKRLAKLLASDPAPTHRAALLRRPGTDNTKFGLCRPCQVIESTGGVCDLSEFGDLFDLYDDQPLLHLKEVEAPEGEPEHKPNGKANGHAEWTGPVDVEARLAAMRHGDKHGNSVNDVQPSVICSLLCRGMHPDEVIETVVNATMAMAERDKLNWSREDEFATVTKRCMSGLNFLQRDYDPATGEIPPWLAGEFHNAWVDALARGRKPTLSRNRSGWHVRSYPLNGAPEEERKEEQADEGAKKNKKSEKIKIDSDGAFALKWFKPIDPTTLPGRQWLYGKHYQRCIVSATVAPGGTGKTSLSMVEAAAMSSVRNLLGEQPDERCRVWLHNGEDSLDELHRRLVAICLKYDLPQEELDGWLLLTSGAQLGLKVANGYSDLKIDSVLIDRIIKTIIKYRFDVFIVDPLVTLHGASEKDNGAMDTVIRIFSSIAEATDCSIDFAHHTRKLPAGGDGEYAADDARGASAIRDAVRSMRVLNIMSKGEASQNGIDEFERLSYFRIDSGKANMAPPAKKGENWFKFESVDLPNLTQDSVGVVTQWTPSATDDVGKARVDLLFLRLLDRLWDQGRFVTNTGGASFAPAVFAKEPEAKEAHLGKAAMGDAMRRLFAARIIKMEDYGARGSRRIARDTPAPPPTEVD
jgi:hypothetical protein